jgi:hypothetical protein
MDERTLFDEFHEALEMEPRPGAYERMRFAMTNQPVVLKRRPAFQMRWSRMGLRVTAAVAAGLIAIAVISVFLVARHAPVGSVPAGQDPHVRAYSAMIRKNYNSYVNLLNLTFNSANNCDSVLNTGCPVAIKTMLPQFQRWLNDLNSFQTPSGYAVIDGQLRRHLSAKVAVLNAVLAFQQAQDENGYSLAMYNASYEVAWLEPTVFALDGDYPRVAGSYQDAVSLAGHALDACAYSKPGPSEMGCDALYQHETCTGAAARNCQSDIQSAETQIQTLLIGLLQNPAPSALANRSEQVQARLAEADTALLATTNALMRGDSAKVAAGESAYMAAILAADASAHSAMNS